MAESLADLRRWREDWYVWLSERGAWRSKSTEWMRAQAGRWLDALGVPHTQSGKGNFMEALLTQVFLDDGLRPPCWVGDGLKRIEDEGRSGHVFVSLSNGILDLDTWVQTQEEGRSLLPHSPDFWTPCSRNYPFDPGALAPKFEEAVRIWQPQEEGRLVLQDWAGYCFVPGHPEQVLLLNIGPGGDGKSQWAEVLTALVGKENVSSVGLEAFDTRKEFGLEPLLGKELNITADANDLERVGEGVLKAIVGGDRVTINRKHKQPIHEALTCKFMLNANQLPPFRDRSEGIWRRLLLLHWEPVDPARRVKDFGKRIVAEEISGIFNWAVAGYFRIKRHGFQVDRAGVLYRNLVEARSEVQKERQFFEECIGYDHTEQVMASKEQLYEAYAEFCKQNGIKKALYADNLMKSLLRWLADQHPQHSEKIEAASIQRRVAEGDEGSKKRRFYKGVYLLHERAVQTAQDVLEALR